MPPSSRVGFGPVKMVDGENYPHSTNKVECLRPGASVWASRTIWIFYQRPRSTLTASLRSFDEQYVQCFDSNRNKWDAWGSAPVIPDEDDEDAEQPLDTQTGKVGFLLRHDNRPDRDKSGHRLEYTVVERPHHPRSPIMQGPMAIASDGWRTLCG